MYLISMEDFDVEVSPYTVFEPCGSMKVFITGCKLYDMIKVSLENEHKVMLKRSSSNGEDRLNNKFMKKSHRNVCFNRVTDRASIIGLLKISLKMPECMENIFVSLIESPRGGKHYTRFVFNCYVCNLLTCTKCNKRCLASALCTLYHNDDKCVNEVESALFKKETIYKPPNCDNMKRKKLCSPSKQCYVKNPLCMF
ncbi:lef-2 [Cryptophlebia peltastica nucleopolyhedrovirus]|uniref:Lef-2 n=1 Tax=Cryptophlebia peltastica nucleopolyhedrovirus TaxID=2304025 RepID=A0A346RNX5_9ABAC|nr:lef-2 [Cryptophlebia peltastica nucleopolyhedrovirus]AXS67772.1 lef-2 [Cryptophlebia peltastica nucleopolyhedrovirus]